jgi:prepilin-type N-terminal cleavage/methylation domain-containing protein
MIKLSKKILQSGFTHAKAGFTLVEALVAISILLVAIIAPMQIAYQGIAFTKYAKNQLVAQYLLFRKNRRMKQLAPICLPDSRTVFQMGKAIRRLVLSTQRAQEQLLSSHVLATVISATE